MKYMLLIYLDEKAITDAQRDQCYEDSAAFACQLHETGHFLDTAPLYPTSTATSVRVQDGKRIVTDGPFAETREQLGGFFMINAGTSTKPSTSPGAFPRIPPPPQPPCRITRARSMAW